MLKILLVEDSAEKQRRIASVISSVPGCGVDGIEVAPNIATARKLLSEHQFDLMLLDMHLPPKLGDDAEMDAGLVLLRGLKDRSRLKLPFHVIAISAFEEGRDIAKQEMDFQLWGTIIYDDRDDAWMPVLKSKLDYLVSSKISLQGASAEGHLVKLGIVTALYEELEAVKEQSDRWVERRFPEDSTVYLEGQFGSGAKAVSVVLATSGRMGMAASAALTSKVIARYRPKFMAMAGIAAGIPGKASLGDILIADPSWDWGSGKFEVKDGEAVFSADPEQVRIDPWLRGHLATAANDRGFLHSIRMGYKGPPADADLRAHIGGVASGAAVIGDSKIVASIQTQKRKMIGVEMEAYGLMVAAEAAPQPRPMVFAAKSVSDFADTDKNDSKRHYATYTSARFIRDFSLEFLT